MYKCGVEFDEDDDFRIPGTGQDPKPDQGHLDPDDEEDGD
jgi:hypothetical protein